MRELYLVTIYFHGPQTTWSQQIADVEVIAEYRAPFLWLARMRARSVMAGLNRGRCGYAITLGPRLAEHCGAQRPELGAVPG